MVGMTNSLLNDVTAFDSISNTRENNASQSNTQNANNCTGNKEVSRSLGWQPTPNVLAVIQEQNKKIRELKDAIGQMKRAEEIWLSEEEEEISLEA